MSKFFRYFSRTDAVLWGISVFMIVLSAAVFRGGSVLAVIASLIGVTSIIINAKGHPAGQLMMIFFALFYGYISWTFSYYGEMMTYLGMTGPMALFSFITWLRNPFKEGRAEVRVNSLSTAETVFMCLLTAGVTLIFFYILRFFHTANLLPSTVSVTTSFAAVYLTMRRSAFFSLVYAMNDIVLIVLWAMASTEDVSYVSVLICFVMFLVSDIYGFVCWMNMKKRQAAENEYPGAERA